MDRARALLAASTLVAAVATLGSLSFSLVLGLNPCDLCWYQRILMYPLVVVLGVAAVDRDVTVWRTVLPLSTFGALIAAYHVYLQVTPTGVTCSFGGGCASVLYPMAGGLLTIPRLSLIAFVLVTAGMVALVRTTRP
ncbi:disulfide bond formation protein B [Halobium palmae]|uniref:Disulfide bond formation protein B n=1 Tax=Halobium palmae TaxID=1776492 RepID=A0ABD5RW24_9EURY